MYERAACICAKNMEKSTPDRLLSAGVYTAVSFSAGRPSASTLFACGAGRAGLSVCLAAHRPPTVPCLVHCSKMIWVHYQEEKG